MSKVMERWYLNQGFIQFLLGNMWNCVDMRNEGRIAVLLGWCGLACGACISVFIFHAIP